MRQIIKNIFLIITVGLFLSACNGGGNNVNNNTGLTFTKPTAQSIIYNALDVKITIPITNVVTGINQSLPNNYLSYTITNNESFPVYNYNSSVSDNAVWVTDNNGCSIVNPNTSCTVSGHLVAIVPTQNGTVTLNVGRYNPDERSYEDNTGVIHFIATNLQPLSIHLEQSNIDLISGFIPANNTVLYDITNNTSSDHIIQPRNST